MASTTEMALSVEDRISTTSLSFQRGILKSLVFFILAFSSLSLVAAAPTDPGLQGRSPSTQFSWGPEYIGDLRLSLTKPHIGAAGPKFPLASHINFNIDKKASQNSWGPVLNLTIVGYKPPKKICLYVYEAIAKKVVFDECFDDLPTAALKCANAIRSFVSDLLREADFFAAILMIAALVAALIVAIPALVFVVA